MRDGYAVRAIDLPGELRDRRRSPRRRAIRGRGGPWRGRRDHDRRADSRGRRRRGDDGAHPQRPVRRARLDRSLRRAAISSSTRKAARPRPTKSCCTPARAWTTAASRCWRPSAHRVQVYRRPVGGHRRHRRRNRGGPRDARSIPDSQFQCLVAGGAGDARRRHRRTFCRWRATPSSTPARSIGKGLAADLLLLSGGVSAGKYDVVEEVLAGFGAEFFFDRVLIQPGQPLVFGRAAGEILLRPAGQSRRPPW